MARGMVWNVFFELWIASGVKTLWEPRNDKRSRNDKCFAMTSGVLHG